MIVAFNYKFAKSNLLPNSSKINFNHANVFCSLFALNHRLLCNHVHCLLRAAGERHARTVIDSIFSQLTLLTPDFLPQFHAPSLITNWLIEDAALCDCTCTLTPFNHAVVIQTTKCSVQVLVVLMFDWQVTKKSMQAEFEILLNFCGLCKVFLPYVRSLLHRDCHSDYKHDWSLCENAPRCRRAGLRYSED